MQDAEVKSTEYFEHGQNAGMEQTRTALAARISTALSED
jgi:hypothetical protein